jgi:hypothetical protein
MENFLTTHKELLQLIKSESSLLSMPPLPDIYRQDQFAFKEYLCSQLLQESTLPSTRELDMHYRIYQLHWDKYEVDIKVHKEQNHLAHDYLYQLMNKICQSQILEIDNAKEI